MGREDPQLKLRLSSEMKDHIVRAARENNRSVNAEIVARLEISVEADQLGWNQENLRIDAVAKLEEATKEAQYQTKVMKWMLEQQQTTMGLLEHIARSDGQLSPDFLEALRSILANRGTAASEFPKHPDDNDE